jgi:hypothetical protein
MLTGSHSPPTAPVTSGRRKGGVGIVVVPYFLHFQNYFQNQTTWKSPKNIKVTQVFKISNFAFGTSKPYFKKNWNLKMVPKVKLEHHKLVAVGFFFFGSSSIRRKS